MTELEISIGGRIFSVACDNEEQEKVREAAALINEEADAIQSTLGRLPESKMLLLSALMIADRLVDLESESKVLKEKSEDSPFEKNLENYFKSILLSIDLSPRERYLNSIKLFDQKMIIFGKIYLFEKSISGTNLG